MTAIHYFLVFSSHFDREAGLDQGRLALNLLPGVKNPVQRPAIWVATSSNAGQQSPEEFHNKGGMLPPQYRVNGLNNYWVETLPINLSNVKGVDGNFFKILPFEVTTDKNGKRGDFGIHSDDNKNGSLGCIVMTRDRFKDFEDKMKLLNRLGISSLPLWIFYS